jgi:hypothetical protein
LIDRYFQMTIATASGPAIISIEFLPARMMGGYFDMLFLSAGRLAAARAASL